MYALLAVVMTTRQNVHVRCQQVEANGALKFISDSFKRHNVDNDIKLNVATYKITNIYVTCSKNIYF